MKAWLTEQPRRLKEDPLRHREAVMKKSSANYQVKLTFTTPSRSIFEDEQVFGTEENASCTTYNPQLALITRAKSNSSLAPSTIFNSPQRHTAIILARANS
jgi:hypothetical protein